MKQTFLEVWEADMPSLGSHASTMVFDGKPESIETLEVWYAQEAIETCLEILDSLCCLMLIEAHMTKSRVGFKSIEKAERRVETFRENKYAPGSIGYAFMTMWNSLNETELKAAAIYLWTAKQAKRGRPPRDIASYIISITRFIADRS